MKHFNQFLVSLCILMCVGSLSDTKAEETAPVQSKISEMDQCLLAAFTDENQEKTLKSVREACEEELAEVNALVPPTVHERIAAERREAFDPYVIVPHKMNYILPFMYSDNINRDVYGGEGSWSDAFKDTEAKFQISIKVPLMTEIFNEGDQVAFGFTLKSWWQVYAREVSSPFRETNYQPEIFYFTPLGWHPFGGHTGIMVGLEHQSNGRSGSISRSWNRAYTNFFFAKNDFIASFRPWYRIPEKEKAPQSNALGDDNPDIADYMGHFELTLAYKLDEYDFVYLGRKNFETGNSGMELGFTFPLAGRLKGYLQYTQGYGESLIDYNHSQRRFGIGIAMTDLF